MIAGKYGRARTILVTVAAAVTCGAVAWGIWQRWSDRPSRQPHGEPLVEEPGSVAIDAGAESRIRAFCGDCHAVPRPESFPRDAWLVEVEKGHRNYVESGRTDLDPPPMGQTVAFFRSRAPETISYPEPQEADAPFRASFQPERLDLDPSVKASAAIATLDQTHRGN